MDTIKLTKNTYRLHQIAGALKKMKERYLSSATSCSAYKQGNFPELAPKFQRRAEIQQMAYNRLSLLFLKQLDEITSAI